jgi:hypothetical protein
MVPELELIDNDLGRGVAENHTLLDSEGLLVKNLDLPLLRIHFWHFLERTKR